MKKYAKILALFLAALMVFSLLPVFAAADDAPIEWTDVAGTSSSGTTYRAISGLSDLKSGEKYIIVVYRYFGGSDSETYNGYVFRSTNNGSLRTTTSDQYATTTFASGASLTGAVWNIYPSGSGYAIYNVSTGKYLNSSNIVASGNSASAMTIVSGTCNGKTNYVIGTSSTAIRYSNSSGTFSFSSNTPSSQTTTANACNAIIYKVVEASSGTTGYSIGFRTASVSVANGTTLSAATTALVNAGYTVYKTAYQSHTTQGAQNITSDCTISGYNPTQVGSQTLTVSYDGREIGTVTVFVQPPESGTALWTTQTETYTVHRYQLDTDGVDNNSNYLIVGQSNAVALGDPNAAAAAPEAVAVTISGNYATVDDAGYAVADWLFTSDGNAASYSTYTYTAASVTSTQSSSYTVSNPTDYYYSDQHYPCTSITCARSGGTGSRRYTWTIKYTNNGTQTYTSSASSSRTLSGVLYTRSTNTTNIAGWTIKSRRNAYLKLSGSTNTEFTFQSALDRMGINRNGTTGQYQITRYASATNTVDFSYTGTAWQLDNQTNASNYSHSTAHYVRLYKYNPTEAQRTHNIGFINASTSVFVGTPLETVLANLTTAGYKVWLNDSAQSVTGATDITASCAMNTSAYDATTPGTYEISVSYNGSVVGTLYVIVKEPHVTSMTLDSSEGIVFIDCLGTAQTGNLLLVTFEDGTTASIPVTFDMLTDASGNRPDNSQEAVYTGLSVTYGGYTLQNYTLNVVPFVEDDYPEYPNKGSIKLEKSADGETYHFQETGVATVELTARGVPASSGVDVIIMLDTSSSMNNNMSGGSASTSNPSRLDILRSTLTTVVGDLNMPNADGTAPDIRVAIADFNGGNLIDFENDYVESKRQGDGDGASMIVNYSHIYTSKSASNCLGTHVGSSDQYDKRYVTTDAFVDIVDLNNHISTVVNAINGHSGTNYDMAMEIVYSLGAQIQAENAQNNEARELMVIFMSDGVPYQYNQMNGQYQGASNGPWAKWLYGTFQASDALNTNYSRNAHTYFYNDDNNKHWIAEAIKGSKEDTFPVILNSTTFPGISAYEETDQQYFYVAPGLGATVYSIGFALGEYQSGTSYSVNNDPRVPEAVLKKMASSEDLYFLANDQTALYNAFSVITDAIRQAAINAVYVDAMGFDYNMQFAPFVVHPSQGVSDTINPSIQIIRYDVYTRAEVGTRVNGVLVTSNMIGVRKGTSTVLETVTFTTNSTTGALTAAASDKLGNTNIYANGIISAKNFYYNTTANPVMIDVDGDGTAETEIAGESFYWKVGTVNESELALKYFVYLEDSMEGGRAAGSYPTNKSATLYYTNWLGHSAEKSVPSPVLPWQSATLNYCFYLVDELGNPIDEAEMPTSVNLAKRVSAIVNLGTLNLNASDEVEAIVADAATLADELGFTLFSPNASFSVTPKSYTPDSSWTITDSTGTTYVTGYSSASDYSNVANVSGSTNGAGYDFTHLTVFFAVTLDTQGLTYGAMNPDTVVIDYGLPVDINVKANDLFLTGGSVVAVGASVPVDSETDEPVKKTSTLPSGFGATLQGLYGDVSIVNGKVRYAPKNMTMSQPETFAYALYYTNASFPSRNGYYYSTVTVIPAANIYYEDSFVTFQGNWTTAGTPVSGATQSEDRPGFTALLDIDANNLYGYDPAYVQGTTFSMGSAKKVNVSSDYYTTYHAWPTATFSFTGNGFDIISMTGTNTGTVTVEVSNSTGTVKKWIVDTYFGLNVEQQGYVKYTWTYQGGVWKTTAAEVVGSRQQDGTASTNPREGDTFETYKENYVWTAASGDKALYQIPVISSRGTDLAYGTYTVTVTPTYAGFFDHGSAGNYDFYFDAVRIYNPAMNNAEAHAAYVQDREANAVFLKFRDNLISQETFYLNGGDLNPGAVYIDAFAGEATIETMTDFGPNHEVYLAGQNAISFKISDENYENIDTVQVAVKAPAGTGKMMLNGKERIIYGAAELFYPVTSLLTWSASNSSSSPFVIQNTGSTTISLTAIKITYKDTEEEPDEGSARLIADGECIEYADRMIAARAISDVEKSEYAREFAPEYLTWRLSRSIVKQGESITVNLVTSADVTAVTVNGAQAKAVPLKGRTDKVGWRITLTPDSVGRNTLNIVCFNEYGDASEAAAAQFNVRSAHIPVCVEEKSATVLDIVASVMVGLRNCF